MGPVTVSYLNLIFIDPLIIRTHVLVAISQALQPPQRLVRVETLWPSHYPAWLPKQDDLGQKHIEN